MKQLALPQLENIHAVCATFMISGDWAQGIADVRKRRAIVNFSQQNIYPINKTVSKLISTDSRGHLLVVLCLPQGWAEDVESGLQVT